MMPWIVLALLSGTIGVLLLIRRKQFDGASKELGQQGRDSKTG